MRFDGINDYADIDDWNWGGATTVEALVKYEKFGPYYRICDFSNGADSDNVYLSKGKDTSDMKWSVRQGSSSKSVDEGNFDINAWTHVVATVSGATMEIYKVS